ncbi:MAG: tyrosine-protein phosphatase [Muribaculaceae bacterium]
MFHIFKSSPKTPHEIFFHTDIHCHLVPGIDDGQKEAEPASELVEREKGWGIDRIFATPHVTQDTYENTPGTIQPAFDLLKEAVGRKGIGVELHYSAEYRMDNFFLQQIKAGNLRPFPNNFLLVENSFVQEAWNLDKLLFDLRVKGYIPVLAHPERYAYYWAKRNRYQQLKDAGILFQVNVLSLAGHYGKQVRKVAEELMTNGWIDFLGTDMHNSEHADALDHYFASKNFLHHARQLEGFIRNDTAF